MNDLNTSFLSRFSLAAGAFFAILRDRQTAASVRRVLDGTSAPDASTRTSTPAEPPPTAAPALSEASPQAAFQLLGLLQRDARFIDFVEEDIAGYSDADIGAAARLVHDGCRAALHEHFTLRPVREEAEGSRITLPDGFDATAIRLTGNVVGQAPFNGNIRHRGWKVEQVRLPKLAKAHDASVIAPAEVEL
jgi:hypothetical protein